MYKVGHLFDEERDQKSPKACRKHLNSQIMEKASATKDLPSNDSFTEDRDVTDFALWHLNLVRVYVCMAWLKGLSSRDSLTESYLHLWHYSTGLISLHLFSYLCIL